MRMGRTTREDKLGNDGADRLAVSGAALHAVRSEVVVAARRRRHDAIQTHEMMLAILFERTSHERRHMQETADRGSEMGDCGGLHEEIGDCIAFNLLDAGLDNGERILSDVH